MSSFFSGQNGNIQDFSLYNNIKVRIPNSQILNNNCVTFLQRLLDCQVCQLANGLMNLFLHLSTTT